jgi:hypothetical protein
MVTNLLRFIVLLVLASMLFSCSFGDHPAVGRWKPEVGFVEIAFYPDGTGSLMMAKVKWSEIDRNSVKIELTENNQTMIVEFTIKNDDKGLLGILHFIGEQRYRKVRE